MKHPIFAVATDKQGRKTVGFRVTSREASLEIIGGVEMIFSGFPIETVATFVVNEGLPVGLARHKAETLAKELHLKTMDASLA